jgi:hypothetical protein
VIGGVPRPGALRVVDPGSIDGAAAGELALYYPLLPPTDGEDVGALVVGSVDHTDVLEAEVPESALGGEIEPSRTALEQGLTV